MKRGHILFLFCLLLLTSFRVEKSRLDWEHKLIGSWVYHSEEVNLLHRKKIDHLEESMGGIQFLQNGKLLVRQNAGWCGTPPISYSNFDGTWKVNADSTLDLTYSFWGGKVVEQWKIEALSDSVLSYRQVHSETHHQPRK